MTFEELLAKAPAPLRTMIKDVAFYQWPNSTAISCNVTLVNDHQVVGTSRPRYDDIFDEEKGQIAAYERTFDDLWKLNAFMVRESAYPFQVTEITRIHRDSLDIARDYSTKNKPLIETSRKDQLNEILAGK